MKPIINLKDLDLERVRKRQSYSFWLEVLNYLKLKPKHQALMLRIWEILDNHSGFGSEQKSFYSAQSLALVLKDKGIG